MLLLVEKCEVVIDELGLAVDSASACAPLGSPDGGPGGFQFVANGNDIREDAVSLRDTLCSAIELAKSAASSEEAKAEAKAAAAARGTPDDQ